MTRARFEYDGRTDEPRPPLRNSTPLLLLVGFVGALLLVLLVIGGLVAFYMANRTDEPGSGKTVDAIPVALRDRTVNVNFQG